jgi:hypothetical protein
LGDKTSFHSNEVILRLSAKTILELTLSLLPLRHFFGIDLLLSSTRECYLSFSLKCFLSCWVLWYLNDLSIERRATSFEQTLVRIMKGWDSSAQGFPEISGTLRTLRLQSDIELNLNSHWWLENLK